jgi:class 3 adenylate cyclase
VHTGEIEIRDTGDIAGTAVNLASRVMDAAPAGRVFVSSTVWALLLGGSTRFEDRGEHPLKGFDEPWRLYELVG